MAVRIRKLAKELGCEPDAIVALLQRYGQTGYGDAEKQIPAGVETLVRGKARELKAIPKPPPGVPLRSAPPRPARPVEPTDEPIIDEAERTLLAREMSGVRPLAGGVRSRPAAPRPVESSRSEAAPRPEPRVPAVDVAAFTARADAAEAARADAERLLAEALSALEEERARARELEARLEETDAHRRSLQRQAAERPAERKVVTLGAALEQRGLIGPDEVALAVRALLDAHRERELFAHLQVDDPEAVSELLWDRVLLIAEGEELPPGLVGVRVPPERSEGFASSANRAAMARFSTACLVRNRKNIVIVGGSPAYRHALEEGIDRRITLHLISGTRRGRIPSPQAPDHVFIWASTQLDHRVSEQFPEGVVLPHRGIARMLAAATEIVESKGRG